MIHRVGTVGSDLHFEDGIRAFPGYTFDRDADAGQIFRKAGVVNGNVNEIANPLGREFH